MEDAHVVLHYAALFLARCLDCFGHDIGLNPSQVHAAWASAGYEPHAKTPAGPFALTRSFHEFPHSTAEREKAVLALPPMTPRLHEEAAPKEKEAKERG